MDRRLLFPAIAVTAFAQQTSPANAKAEKALRASAEQFYQLEVQGKFREAEALVAKDTKEYFFDNGKPNLRSFKLGKVEFTDKSHAVVTLIATVTMTAPALGPTEVPVTALHTWKLENGKWQWYVDQKAGIDTPFGKMRSGTTGAAGPGAAGSGLPFGLPDFSKPGSQVSIDKTTVSLSAGPDRVTITNHLPGTVGLEISPNRPKGLIVEMDKSQLAQNEKAVVLFRASDGAKPAGAVLITASPLNLEFHVQIKAE